ncbi:MAG: hypothetical protein IT158_15725 [Bryobacterales bacterium]|nr:hypothetical protein [Bryobacterales bacterium]
MDYSGLIERVYEHVENDDVGKAVMACLRLARNVQDYLNAAIFLRELEPDRDQFARTFLEDTVKLNQDQRRFLLKQSSDTWLQGRTLKLMGSTSSEGEVLVFSAGQLDTELTHLERAIQDMVLPAGMSPFDVAAFTDKFMHDKAALRCQIQQVQIVRQRIKARCLNYAISLERQLQTQQKSQTFLEIVQQEVNNYFRARSEDVYLKLQKAADLIGSSSSEDASLLLTLVRRTMKSVADYFYPPRLEPVVCSDGNERILSGDKYITRLGEYLLNHFPSGSQTALLQAQCDLLMNLFSRLNEVACKGVHAKVTGDEAKQALISLYMFLFSVISRLMNEPEGGPVD